jgi:RNA polymerase sigma-70 factor (TIGR02960 family)
MPDVEVPRPTRLGEVVWLEPYPDVLLADLPDTAAGPEARYETREAVSLAFITALQLLPPRQRAALILCDVLDFPARQVAGMLDGTEQSVASALKRTRATLAREVPKPDQPAPAANSPAEQELLSRLVQAFEDSDVEAVVALMTDDVWIRMPPVPLEYQGRELAARFFGTIAFRQGRRYRLVPTRANGQPALGVYLRDPLTEVAHTRPVRHHPGGRARERHHPIRQRGIRPVRPAQDSRRLIQSTPAIRAPDDHRTDIQAALTARGGGRGLYLAARDAR